MKKILGLIVLVIVIASCSQEQKGDPFTVNAEITGIDSGKAYLKHFQDKELVTLDSVNVEQGLFQFASNVDVAERHYITFSDVPGIEVAFFAEPGEITIKGKLEEMANVLIEGSTSEEIHRTFRMNVESYGVMLQQLYSDYQEAGMNEDSVLMESITEKYSMVSDKVDEFVIDYVGKNVNSVVAPFIIMRNKHLFEFDTLTAVYDRMTAEVQGSIYGKSVKERIDKLAPTQVGQVAPEFEQMSVDSTMISLKDFRGQYVLVDFWASWCGPCRAENPNVVANFNKYKDKGFTVFGVSFDTNRERWLKAIEADELDWPQVSDLQGWKNEVGTLYGISSIPQNILVDPEGVIVGKNLREEGLGEKLAEIFGE